MPSQEKENFVTYAVLTKKPVAQEPETGVESRRLLATSLTGVLADSFVLMIKTQSYHWNVVGPLFQPLHEMTEAQYRDVFEAIDEIAERIRALGEVAPLSFTDLISHASLAEETRAKTAASMVAQLVSDHEALARRFRDLGAEAAGAGDGVTEDLANSRMAFHEKTAWMLRSVIAE